MNQIEKFAGKLNEILSDEEAKRQNKIYNKLKELLGEEPENFEFVNSPNHYFGYGRWGGKYLISYTSGVLEIRAPFQSSQPIHNLKDLVLFLYHEQEREAEAQKIKLAKKETFSFWQRIFRK